MNRLELEDLMSRLDLSKDSTDTQRPSYTDLYPQGWGRDALAELQHREAVHKIVRWPVDEDNKVNSFNPISQPILSSYNCCQIFLKPIYSQV